MNIRESLDLHPLSTRVPGIGLSEHSLRPLSEAEVRNLIDPWRLAQPRRSYDGRVPFKGLDAFRENDAEFFFGRTALIQELVRRIAGSTCLGVVGPCGCGKSSLVRAGLLPALRGGALSASERWRFAVMTPGQAPLRALSQALVTLTGQPDSAHDLIQHAASDAARLTSWLKAGFANDAQCRAVLVVDAFEELFTQVECDVERQVLIAQLCTAAERVSDQFRLVLVVRGDFVDALARYPALKALVGSDLIQVGALRTEDVLQAVVLPALHVGLAIDPALVARIMADMRQGSEPLSLLQFALLDLFQTQRDRDGVPQLTLDGYLRRGGLQHALRRHADAVFDGFSPAQQTIARRLLRRVIVVRDGLAVARTSVRLADVSFPATPAAAVHDVARQLLKSQLLTAVDGQAGLERTITLTHETLLAAWPALNALIIDARAGQRWLATLSGAALDWDRSGRDPAFLLAGTRLVHLRRFLADWEVVTPPMVQVYLDASVAHGEERGTSEPSRRVRQRRPSWFREGRAFVARYWPTFRTSARPSVSSGEFRDPSD